MEQFKGICKILLTSAVAMAVVHSARAQSSAITTQQPVVAPDVKPKKLSVVGIVTHSSDLAEDTGQAGQTVTTYELNPNYRLSSKAAIGTLLALEQEHGGLEETRVLNTLIYISRDPLKINEDTDLSLTVQGLLPTDEAAREDATLQGAAGGIAKVSHRLKTFGRPSSLSYSLNTFKYFHEFDRTNERSSNLSARFRNTLGYSVAVTSKLEAAVSGFFQTGLSYDNVVKESIYLEQSLSYSVAKNFSMGLIHSTGGPAFERNGKDWNLEAYDSRNSNLAASLTYVY